MSNTIKHENIEQTDKQDKLKIGYFALRGRAQVPRLLLEYLKVPYEDELFSTKAEWLAYKQRNLKKWPLLDLPYLIDGDLCLTETVPICYYLVNKYGPMSMLGSTPQHTAILDMYCWSIDTMGVGLAALLWAQGTKKELTERKQRFWLETVNDKMSALQSFLGTKEWMLGALSLFDFSIYELIHYVAEVFPLHIKSFPRLRALESRVSLISEIHDYENSSRAIKAQLPPYQGKSPSIKAQ